MVVLWLDSTGQKASFISSLMPATKTQPSLTMLSSRSNSSDDAVEVEVVRPDDGRLESVWVALFIAAVVLLGALGIWARQTPATLADPSASLTTAERQLLLELSIAADEIEFMQGLLGEEALSLANLTQQALLPLFVGQDFQAWQTIEQGCFLLAQPNTRDRKSVV